MSKVEVKDELVIMSVEDVPKGYDDVESKLDTELGLYNVVSEIKSPSTLKSATSTMGKIKKWKGKVEAKRVEIKAPALALCEAIDTEAKRIQAKIVDAWTPWSDAIETYKTKLETEELERKVSRLNAVDGLVTEEELQFIDIYNMDDETFNKFVEFRKSITIVPVVVEEADVVEENEPTIEVEPIEEEVLEVPTIDKPVESNIQPKPTTSEPVDTNVGLLTDDDEFAMFNTFFVRFSKIKKPATFSSETAIKLRNAIDDLDEMLNNALGGTEE